MSSSDGDIGKNMLDNFPMEFYPMILKYLDCDLSSFALLNKRCYDIFNQNKNYIITSILRRYYNIDINIDYKTYVLLVKEYKILLTPYQVNETNIEIYKMEDDDLTDPYWYIYSYAAFNGHLNILKFLEKISKKFSISHSNHLSLTLYYISKTDNLIDILDYIFDKIVKGKKYTDGTFVDFFSTIMDIENIKAIRWYVEKFSNINDDRYLIDSIFYYIRWGNNRNHELYFYFIDILDEYDIDIYEFMLDIIINFVESEDLKLADFVIHILDKYHYTRINIDIDVYNMVVKIFNCAICRNDDHLIEYCIKLINEYHLNKIDILQELIENFIRIKKIHLAKRVYKIYSDQVNEINSEYNQIPKFIKTHFDQKEFEETFADLEL